MYHFPYRTLKFQRSKRSFLVFTTGTSDKEKNKIYPRETVFEMDMRVQLAGNIICCWLGWSTTAITSVNHARRSNPRSHENLGASQSTTTTNLVSLSHPRGKEKKKSKQAVMDGTSGSGYPKQNARRASSEGGWQFEYVSKAEPRRGTCSVLSSLRPRRSNFFWAGEQRKKEKKSQYLQRLWV
jgi:hypothetical protein